MAALSKEEFEELDKKLNQDQRIILARLAEVHSNDLRNPWVDMETLRTAIGGFNDTMRAEMAVQRLYYLRLISTSYHRKHRKTMVAISQKGCDYVEFHKNKLIISHIFKKKLLWPLAFLVIIGLLASISTGNFLIFVLTIIGSIIAGLIVFVITKLHYSKGD